VIKKRISAIENAINVRKGLPLQHDSRYESSSTAVEDEVPTAPSTPSQNPPPSQIPKQRRQHSPTPPVSNQARGDPSVVEIATVLSSHGASSSITAVGPSNAPLSQPEPRRLKKVSSIIDLASDNSDEEMWNQVDEVPMDDYRTHMALPIAPTRALTVEPLPPQDTEVPAPSPSTALSAAATTADSSERNCYASPYYPEIIQKLKGVFGLHKFRPNQLKAVTTTMSGKDVFVLMPTGGGKSLCYQLPAICNTGKTKGVTFVVSPLLALMNDQVRALKALDIYVVALNSEQDADQRRKVNDALKSKTARKPSLVYITPEGIAQNQGLAKMLTVLNNNGQLARFIIDEAHLISSWGRDFRDSASTPPF
jgi:hypothetical protein